MSVHRQVWETLARLLARVEQGLVAPQGGTPTPPGAAEGAGLEQELRKLGKTQFKANLLAEEQAARLEKALAALQTAQGEQAKLIAALDQARGQAGHRDLLETILPALDGLENAIASGQRYLQKRDLAARKTGLTPEQAILVSPADRAMLAGWLDGLHLVRERLLAVLAAGEVTPIPTVGQPFDPYQHIAVGVTHEAPPGTASNGIVAEERRGYRSPQGVLRFAEVIVYRPR